VYALAQRSSCLNVPTGGRVVFLSSTLTAASLGTTYGSLRTRFTDIRAVPPHVLCYAATKGAIEQITRVLAKELGPKGVTVNAVSPGPVDTELFRTGKTEQQIQFYENLHPLKRIGRPDEVASIVAMLSSPESSWVNGQTILVNGVRGSIYHTDQALMLCVRVLSSDFVQQRAVNCAVKHCIARDECLLIHYMMAYNNS
jgi:NAD(P)-dependent dehydrogenase (short-subunit alcohol dehydrogenase family)